MSKYPAADFGHDLGAAAVAAWNDRTAVLVQELPPLAVHAPAATQALPTASDATLLLKADNDARRTRDPHFIRRALSFVFGIAAFVGFVVAAKPWEHDEVPWPGATSD